MNRVTCFGQGRQRVATDVKTEAQSVQVDENNRGEDYESAEMKKQQLSMVASALLVGLQPCPSYCSWKCILIFSKRE